MIKEGDNLDVRNRMGYTLLHIAASAGRKEIVECLVKNGANVNSEIGFSLLVCAIDPGISQEDEGIIHILINNGADINVDDPLGHAVDNMQERKVRILLENRADINAKNYLNTIFNFIEDENDEARCERIAKLLIRHMFYSVEKPQYLSERGNRFSVYDRFLEDIYLRCSQYWDVCCDQLYSSDNEHLCKLLKSENLDEQIKMWCENEDLRNYCTDLKVLRSKSQDLEDAATNIAHRIKKEIFLRNNKDWEYLINRHLLLADIQTDLENKVKSVLNNAIHFLAGKELCIAPKEFINTEDVLSVPKLKMLTLLECDKLPNDLKKKSRSTEEEQSSVLRDVLTPECLKAQHCNVNEIA